MSEPTVEVNEPKRVPGAPDHRDGTRSARQIVPSVVRAVRILNALAEDPDAGLADLSRRLDLPRSSTLALCNSLVTTGLLDRDRAGTYRLGPHVLELSRSFLRQADLHIEFQRVLAELKPLPEQTIVCAVLRERDVVYIGRRPGSFPLGLSYEVGVRLPAHCAASGLAILSTLSEAVLAERYAGLEDRDLESLTPKSRTSVASLTARLAEVRRMGYATDDEETALGMVCVGVAVKDGTGAAVGAVAVSLTKGTFAERDVKAVAAEIQQLAGRISERLGMPRVNEASQPG